MKKIKYISRILGLSLFMVLMALPEAGAERKSASQSTQELTEQTVSTGETPSRRRRAKRQSPAENQGQATASTGTQTKAQSDSKSRRSTTSNPKNTTSTADASKNKNSKGPVKIGVLKPDLEVIKKESLNPKSKFYFPTLYKKYESNDYRKMTPEEYRYLYLGYMFQEDYDPYRSSPYAKITEEYRDKEKRTKADTDSIIKYAKLALQDNPFDLRQMSFLVHVLKERDKNAPAEMWEYRLENLLGAIKSTGTGQSEEDAWYVIYPMHEYDMLTVLGYEAVDVDYVEPGYDYLKVQPDGSKKFTNPAKGFFFNVQVLQEQYEWKHPEIDDEALGADYEEE